jgi:hypothetical protein
MVVGGVVLIVGLGVVLVIGLSVIIFGFIGDLS